MTTGTTSFVADPSEIKIRRREGSIVLAIALMLLLPALLSLGWGLLNLPFRPDYAAEMVRRAGILLFLPGIGGVVFGARALQVITGRTTVVVLEPEALRVPAKGTRNVRFFGLEDGFRYAYRKRVLAVRVPYGRLGEVRRVVDDEEKAWLTVPHPHRTVRVRGLKGLGIKARGYAWMGKDAMEQAPMLIAAEFGRCWVRDPDAAVAITLEGLQQDGQPHAAVPQVLESVTLYVSVEHPDRLVAALRKRRDRSEPLPTPEGRVGTLPALKDVRPP